jgi:hypothetical protein
MKISGARYFIKSLLTGFVFVIDLALSMVAVDIFGPPSLVMPDLPFAGSETHKGPNSKNKRFRTSLGGGANCENNYFDAVSYAPYPYWL